MVLAADHAEVKALLAELEHGPDEPAGTDQDGLDLRKRMTQALVIEASRHEALEEMFFWPAVREHHPDRLVSQGLPPEILARAAARVARINAAHDQLIKEHAARV